MVIWHESKITYINCPPSYYYNDFLFLFFRKAENLRQNRAAITIQRYVRGWLCYSKFIKLRRSILGIQTYGRGMLARKSYKIVLDTYKITEIQRFCRGYLARQAFKKKLRLIIKCQATLRGYLARRLYRKMKAEARTISHITKKYKGLENKIISLQQRIDELNKDNNQLKIKTSEIPEFKSKLELMKNLENELKTLRIELKQSKMMTEDLTKKLEVERDEKMLLVEQKTNAEKEWKVEKQSYILECDKLRKNLENMVEVAKNEEIGKYYKYTFSFYIY